MSLINPYTGKPVTKDGFVYFFEGSTGTGKTTLIQSIITRIPLNKTGIDFSGEYTKFGIKPIKLDGRSPKKVGLELIGKYCDLWETVIVLSEAGIYVDNKGKMDDRLKMLLKEARKRGNWIFADFHKLSEIDIGALGLSDRLYMKRSTMETMAQIKKFFHYIEIERAYREVMNDTKHVVIKGRKYYIGTRSVDTKRLTLKDKF